MSSMEDVKAILDSTLGLGGRAQQFTESTPLLGGIPELDSMAVVTVMTTLEEQYGFTIEDDDVSAETFETLGSLVSFVDTKLAG